MHFPIPAQTPQLALFLILLPTVKLPPPIIKFALGTLSVARFKRVGLTPLQLLMMNTQVKPKAMALGLMKNRL